MRTKTYLTTAIACLALACSPSNKEKDTTQIWSQKMVEAHGLGDFYCNKSYQETLNTTGWDYVSGLVANAVLKTWQLYPEKSEYYDAVKAFADNSTNEDGTMILNPKGEFALRPSNIDDLPAGNIYFTLYKEELRKGNTKDAERYKQAATLIRNTLKYNHARIPENLPGTGGFYHKASYPNQMWLDGLYMGSPIYAQWQATFGTSDSIDNQESWNDIALQFKTIHQYTYNPDIQLNYHAWAADPKDPNAFWAKPDEPYKGCSPEFWGRGMGWYIAALVDVLEYMPKNHPEYANLNTILQQVAAGIKRWQDPKSGTWYQLLQYDANTTADGKGDIINGQTYNVGTKPNYLEASCSGIFTYALLKGIRLGLLDTETYLSTATKAYQGLLTTFIREENGKLDIIQTCASAGLGPAKDPSRTGTINYYLEGKDTRITQNEGKAIGTFILASIEYEQLTQP